VEEEALSADSLIRALDRLQHKRPAITETLRAASEKQQDALAQVMAIIEVTAR
ncbi:UDP-N-acetylglucosamine--N-acetylmuramyl-(pentapeptide) pyrophosphoryl-undecaprenol N-acetylglucosamine transferase, partial [Klebsiella pneumoniae]|nr:UDP-N-acetylglucosamine--N-acetylmuramyl-(pentapeptide) pyrophosphoryl-undecaprenol N-acetylglucosamine transferase [Klebsiella pneumoniae]